MPSDAPAAAAAATTTDTVKPTGPAQAADKAQAATADGSVKVKPLASYFCSATGQHRAAGGDAYAVEPSHAAELFAVGLVDYDKPEDEANALEIRVKAAAEAARARRGR